MGEIVCMSRCETHGMRGTALSTVCLSLVDVLYVPLDSTQSDFHTNFLHMHEYIRVIIASLH